MDRFSTEGETGTSLEASARRPSGSTIAGRGWDLSIEDCRTWLPDQWSADVTITDPPYDAQTHGAQRRQAKAMEDGKIRKADLGFAPLDASLRRLVARELVRITERWILIFCATEQAHLWRNSLIAAGGRYLRTGFWRKINPSPQFSGDRPAVACEAIVIGWGKQRGRLAWNGGGLPAFWEAPLGEALWFDEPIEIARSARSAGGVGRIHTTQKPLKLMETLIRLFSDENDLICDPFAGGGTTGAAALRLGRRFTGCEKEREFGLQAAARLHRCQDERGLSPRKARQLSLVGVP